MWGVHFPRVKTLEHYSYFLVNTPASVSLFSFHRCLCSQYWPHAATVWLCVSLGHWRITQYYDADCCHVINFILALPQIKFNLFCWSGNRFGKLIKIELFAYIKKPIWNLKLVSGCTVVCACCPRACVDFLHVNRQAICVNRCLGLKSVML